MQVWQLPVIDVPVQAVRERSLSIFALMRSVLRDLSRLFNFRSLRTQLVLIVVAIDIVAAMLTDTIIILKARTATKVEIASSMQLAEMLVPETMRLLQDTTPALILQAIGLQFHSIRHVKVALTDQMGRSVPSPRQANAPEEGGFTPEAPQWFSSLIAPPNEIKNYPIIVHGHQVGIVTISSEPSDEVAEAWSYAYSLIITTCCLNIMVLAVLIVLFDRVLSPLPRLVAGLRDLEAKNYTVRLPNPALHELSPITDHFNKAAEALLAAQRANQHLNRKLLTIQDEERRRTALELHDEAGGYLFALQANANSILFITKDQLETSALKERAREIGSLVATVQEIHRRILDRLKPMTLGQIPLKECLVKLIMGLDSAEEGPEISYRIGVLPQSYDPIVDLTVYRCVQEGLLNALRHANAAFIEVAVEERGDAGVHLLAVGIRDDGQGLRKPSGEGFGLFGIRERIEALNGSFEMASSAKGTHLEIRFPVAEPSFLVTPKQRPNAS